MRFDMDVVKNKIDSVLLEETIEIDSVVVNDMFGDSVKRLFVEEGTALYNNRIDLSPENTAKRCALQLKNGTVLIIYNSEWGSVDIFKDLE